MKKYKFYYIDTYFYSGRVTVKILTETILASTLEIATNALYKIIDFDKINCKILKTEEHGNV